MTDEFPDDENGQTLTRMYLSGDNLRRPRTIDFSAIFDAQKNASAFCSSIKEKRQDCAVQCYEEGDGLFDVTVSVFMVPTHKDISNFEALVRKLAAENYGEDDGWGCLSVD